MDRYEIENWQKVKEGLEKAGMTDSYLYKRALLICAGQHNIPGLFDDLPNHETS